MVSNFLEWCYAFPSWNSQAFTAASNSYISRVQEKIIETRRILKIPSKSLVYLKGNIHDAQASDDQVLENPHDSHIGGWMKHRRWHHSREHGGIKVTQDKHIIHGSTKSIGPNLGERPAHYRRHPTLGLFYDFYLISFMFWVIFVIQICCFNLSQWLLLMVEIRSRVSFLLHKHCWCSITSWPPI